MASWPGRRDEFDSSDCGLDRRTGRRQDRLPLLRAGLRRCDHVRALRAARRGTRRERAAVRAPTHAAFAGRMPGVTVSIPDDIGPMAHYKCPLLGLPRIFGTKIDTNFLRRSVYPRGAGVEREVAWSDSARRPAQCWARLGRRSRISRRSCTRRRIRAFCGTARRSARPLRQPACGVARPRCRLDGGSPRHRAFRA